MTPEEARRCENEKETAWCRGLLAGVAVTIGTIILTGLLIIRWEIVTCLQ
jgi:hypothetical protein